MIAGWWIPLISVNIPLLSIILTLANDSRSLPSPNTLTGKGPSNEPEHYVELGVFVDAATQSFFRNENSTARKTIEEIVELANNRQSLFEPLRFSITLKYYEEWQDNKFSSDLPQCPSSGCEEDLYQTVFMNFSRYIHEHKRRTSFDHSHLFTNSLVFPLTRPTGLAALDEVCSPNISLSISLIRYSLKRNGISGQWKLSQAATLTHEIAHSIGLEDDSDECCAGSECVMSERSNVNGNRIPRWSACSRQELATQVRRNRTWCLRNKPERLVGSAALDVADAEAVNSSETFRISSVEPLRTTIGVETSLQVTSGTMFEHPSAANNDNDNETASTNKVAASASDAHAPETIRGDFSDFESDQISSDQNNSSRQNSTDSHGRLMRISTPNPRDREDFDEERLIVPTNVSRTTELHDRNSTSIPMKTGAGESESNLLTKFLVSSASTLASKATSATRNDVPAKSTTVPSAFVPLSTSAEVAQPHTLVSSSEFSESSSLAYSPSTPSKQTFDSSASSDQVGQSTHAGRASSSIPTPKSTPTSTPTSTLTSTSTPTPTRHASSKKYWRSTKTVTSSGGLGGLTRNLVYNTTRQLTSLRLSTTARPGTSGRSKLPQNTTTASKTTGVSINRSRSIENGRTGSRSTTNTRSTPSGHQTTRRPKANTTSTSTSTSISTRESVYLRRLNTTHRSIQMPPSTIADKPLISSGHEAFNFTASLSVMSSTGTFLNVSNGTVHSNSSSLASSTTSRSAVYGSTSQVKGHEIASSSLPLLMSTVAEIDNDVWLQSDLNKSAEIGLPINQENTGLRNLTAERPSSVKVHPSVLHNETRSSTLVPRFNSSTLANRTISDFQDTLSTSKSFVESNTTPRSATGKGDTTIDGIRGANALNILPPLVLAVMLMLGLLVTLASLRHYFSGRSPQARGDQLLVCHYTGPGTYHYYYQNI